MKVGAAVFFVCAAAAVTMAGCRSTPPPDVASRPATVTPPDDPDVAPEPTAADVRILHRAAELLADASAWNHFGDRTCDANAHSWNLYCVLQRASIDVTGSFEHRSAALQEVRWVVDERTRGMELGHRLMGYNNLETTSFADIKEVLAESTRRLEAKVRKDRPNS